MTRVQFLALLAMLLLILTVSIFHIYAVDDCECAPDVMLTRTPVLVLETPSVEDWLEWVE